MMKIESVTVIPMNKETIFDEPYSEDEMFNCTLDYDEWDRITSSVQDMSYPDGILERIPETEEIVRKFKGFITGPVAKYGKKVLVAKTKQFNSISDILSYDFSNCFLYVVWPCRDETGYSYKVRYAELD